MSRWLVLLLTATVLDAADPPGADIARKELFAAHWEQAAKSYRAILRRDPTWARGYDYLVRALVAGKKTAEAYSAADDGVKNAPQTAEFKQRSAASYSAAASSPEPGKPSARPSSSIQ